MSGKLFTQLALSMIGCAMFAQPNTAPAKYETYTHDKKFAPYVDMALAANNLPQLHADSGIRTFTIAFINAAQGCAPAWSGGNPVDTEDLIRGYVDELRKEGGDVIVAFGGYNGTELAQACGDALSLQKAYQQVVDKYRAKILDFDVEHFAIEDQVSIDRRNEALKNLVRSNPGLQIQLTLPATSAGLTPQALNVLKSALGQGTPVQIVNVMTMDFLKADPSRTMGENAISAIESAQNQIKELGLNAKLGITLMLGINDAAGETFTLTDAASLLSYAQKNQNVALLSFWSVARDNGSCKATVSPSCSGIEQKPWQFSRLFAAFH